MKNLIEIFLMFTKLASFSFGGGYVMIPIMIEELETYGWATVTEIADVIAISGMSPGPVSVNASVGIGYILAGIPGVIVALLGIIIPCTVIVISVAMFFFKVYHNPYVKSALYGMRCVVTGIIFYAAIKLALGNGIFLANVNNVISSGWNVEWNLIHLVEIKSLIIIVLTFILLVKTKIHPIFIIIACGVTGVIIY